MIHKLGEDNALELGASVATNTHLPQRHLYCFIFDLQPVAVIICKSPEDIL
jgi:hypothetical protein